MNEIVFTQEEPEATFIDCGWNPSLQVNPIMGTTSKALLCECTLLELLRICCALLDWAIDDMVNGDVCGICWGQYPCERKSAIHWRTVT